MNLNKKEINFINECIDLYWDDYNPHHEDNKKNKMISDNLVKKLTLTDVVGQSGQLFCGLENINDCEFTERNEYVCKNVRKCPYAK